HSIIFFIFLVCNVGGSLTPLGDPPLFLGFLQGVGFFWTTTHLWWEMLFVVALLLIIYYLWDRRLYKREQTAPETTDHKAISIDGKFNFVLLAGVLAFVLFSGIVNLGSISVYGVDLPVAGLIRDAGLLILTWISWRIT